MKSEVKKAKFEFNQNKNDDLWKNYQIKRNEYKKELKNAENSYVQNKIVNSRNNSRTLWKNIKNLYEPKNNNINSVKFNGTIENDSIEIARKFNSFFVNSLKEINDKIPPPQKNDYLNKITKIDNKFKLNSISLNKLKKILKNIKNKKFVDNINGKVLNDAMLNPIFAVEFCNLINEILLTGIMPSSWKVSTIVPINKVPNAKTDIQFRPINMLPIYEKVLENVIKEQLQEYITANKILIEEQSGFRAQHSCETALNDVIDSWLDCIQKDEFVVCVFLDFKRAFETVDRKVLLKKLKIYGIDHEFFSNYLINRKHRTKVNDSLSEEIDCGFGLPQGTGLAPLLFILFINDLIKNLNHLELRLFADDTLLMISGKNLETLIEKTNKDLCCINDWLNFNYLALNTDKTKAMIITLKNVNYHVISNIKINDSRIDFVFDYKYLGFWIDCKLKLDKHTQMIVNKMLSKLYLFKRLAKKLNVSTLSMLYKSLVAPQINYCSSLLSMLNDSQIDKIQKVQNRFMRLILKAHWLTPIKNMLSELNWLSIKQLICFNTLKLIFKMEQGETPEYLTRRLIKRKQRKCVCVRLCRSLLNSVLLILINLVVSKLDSMFIQGIISGLDSDEVIFSGCNQENRNFK
jgi:hypothetical protein